MPDRWMVAMAWSAVAGTRTVWTGSAPWTAGGSPKIDNADKTPNRAMRGSVLLSAISPSCKLGLFRGQFPDHRQHHLLALVSLHQQINPKDKKCQVDQANQIPHTPGQDGSERHPDDDHRHMQEDRLKSVKANQLALVIRFQNQEDNPGDQAQHVAKSRRGILRQSGRRDGRQIHNRRRRRWIHGRPTLGAIAPFDLRSTTRTKSHCSSVITLPIQAAGPRRGAAIENTRPPRAAPRIIAMFPAPIRATTIPASPPMAMPTKATTSRFTISCYAHGSGEDGNCHLCTRIECSLSQ